MVLYKCLIYYYYYPDTDCELLWVQIDLTGAKSLHIGAFYTPPDSDVTTLENLNQSLQRLTHRTNGNIWLGGDFNAPHINWPMLEVTPLAGTKRQIYQRPIDISLHHNIEQIIDKPTKGDNILDLFRPRNSFFWVVAKFCYQVRNLVAKLSLW